MHAPLGWLHVCLPVDDIARAKEFYERLTFRQVDGNVSEGWAIMHHGTTEFALFTAEHCTEVTLNFRGGDIGEIVRRLGEQEIAIEKGPHLGEDGTGAGSANIRDPEGNAIFFDTTPEERRHFLSGARLSVGEDDGSLKEGQLLLGNHTYCLDVVDIRRAVGFYEKLGLKQMGGDISQNWAIVGDDYQHLSLFQGIIDLHMLNFRGGDVFAIAAELKKRGFELTKDAARADDGSEFAEFKDPDDRVIYFNTFPAERLY